MSPQTIGNKTARRIFLDRHALLEPPTGPAQGSDLLALILRLGFVQVDSINTVERAHHMILWTRRQRYRPSTLRKLLEGDRLLFEHWTHDAAIIPMEFLPWWQGRFEQNFRTLPQRWNTWQGTAFQDLTASVLAQIRDSGPLGSKDVGRDKRRGSGGWWDWHPSKTALEYLWHSGIIAVSRRDGFRKIFAPSDQVYPAFAAPGAEETIEWACQTALERLGFATTSEIAAFWKLVRVEEVRQWAIRAIQAGKVEHVQITGADGACHTCLAPCGLADTADRLVDPTDRIRILSPFDPAIRDRRRTLRLFGFEYRIEVFVPGCKRQYGYYVFPLLEGDVLIGRIDLKCQRAQGTLMVTALWPEPRQRFGKGRMQRLMSELTRLGKFTSCPNLGFAAGWLKDAKHL